MKKRHKLSLDLKLLACLLSVVFVLSLIHLLSYMRLLDTTTREAKSSANERMASAAARLDESLSSIRSGYFSLTYTTSFRALSHSGAPSEYALVDLYDKANLYLGNNSDISAYAIFFRYNDHVVTSDGNYPDTQFFSRFYASELYPADFWRAEKLETFAQRYYPEDSFLRDSPISHAENQFLPVTFKPYWNSNIMVLLFLDIADLCARADQYLTEDFYIFATDGRLLYSSEEEPAITELPGQTEALAESPEGDYIARRASTHGDFIYVKRLPKNIVVGQITRSVWFSLLTALAALVLSVAVATASILRMLHPVRDILRLLPEAEGAGDDELLYIRASVEAILHQREQYAQMISQKDAALSGFLLQSQLKNIYVELDAPDAPDDAAERVFHILYFRIHYRSGTLDSIEAEPPAVSYMLMENLRQALTRLFDTALIFQLEPTQFVAKVGLAPAGGDVDTRMERLLRQLDNEGEYAFFTVVQSGAVRADGEFTAVYEQVLDAAQYAPVSDATCLLRLPLETGAANGFRFPSDQAQQLRALVRDGRSDEAAALTERILRFNLERGILRIHMILLCSSIASAALHALTELRGEGGVPDIGSGSVYSTLPQCDTARDFIELASGFVRSAALCAAAYPRAGDAILEGVQAFLESNYQREFSMDELAEALHLSKSYLSTYYKGKTGANLSDHIHHFRIQKALVLLNDPKLRVADVGAAVGISNINTFLRQFKKYTGTTPREYRAHRGGAGTGAG